MDFLWISFGFPLDFLWKSLASRRAGNSAVSPEIPESGKNSGFGLCDSNEKVVWKRPPQINFLMGSPRGPRIRYNRLVWGGLINVQLFRLWEDFLWISFGFPLDFLWISFGFPLDFLWISFGFPLDFLGLPLDFLWISFGFPLDFLWISFGFPHSQAS